MNTPISRRFALFRIGAGAAVATAAVATAPAGAAVENGPITPNDFLAASVAIGWRHVTGFYIARTGTVRRMGVIEYYDHEGRAPHWADDQIARIRLMQRVGKSGPDFWNRVGDHLWELGETENVRPYYPRNQARIALAE